MRSSVTMFQSTYFFSTTLPSRWVSYTLRFLPKETNTGTLPKSYRWWWMGGMPKEAMEVLSILLPKPWCQISSWALMIAVFKKKPFFYNFASLSSLLCAIVFFIYPGVGFNNVYILFENWYSICTHALLLTTSITLMCFRYTEFRYKTIWKTAICFLLVFVYGLLQVFVLKVHADPLYFMPDGDIQADILKISYGLYMVGYVAVFLIYTNVPYLIGDKQTVKSFFAKQKERLTGKVSSVK